LIVWNIVEPNVLNHVVLNHVPAQVAATLDAASTDVLINRVEAIASGFGVTDTPAAYSLLLRSNWRSFKALEHLQKLQW
jgi:phosphate transport system permease protein